MKKRKAIVQISGMMKNIDLKKAKLYTMLALMTVGAGLTACSNDEETTEQVNTYSMSVDATKQMDDNPAQMRRALSLEGDELIASWATTEQVYVQGRSYSTNEPFWFRGYLKPNKSGTITRLNGTVSLPEGWVISVDEAIGDPHVLTLQFPRSGNLDYAGQKGTLADIAENYDYAIATDVRYDIKENHIEGVTMARFVNMQAIVKFSLIDKASGIDMLNPTALTVDHGTGNIALNDIPNTTYSTNGNGVLFVAIPGFDDQTVRLTATVGGDTYTFTKKGVTFENGKFYEINVKMTKN